MGVGAYSSGFVRGGSTSVLPSQKRVGNRGDSPKSEPLSCRWARWITVPTVYCRRLRIRAGLDPRSRFYSIPAQEHHRGHAVPRPLLEDGHSSRCKLHFPGHRYNSDIIVINPSFKSPSVFFSCFYIPKIVRCFAAICLKLMSSADF